MDLGASHLRVRAKEEADLVLPSSVRGCQEVEIRWKGGNRLARDHKVCKCAWPLRTRVSSQKPGASMKIGHQDEMLCIPHSLFKQDFKKGQRLLPPRMPEVLNNSETRSTVEAGLSPGHLTPAPRGR